MGLPSWPLPQMAVMSFTFSGCTLGTISALSCQKTSALRRPLAIAFSPGTPSRTDSRTTRRPDPRSSIRYLRAHGLLSLPLSLIPVMVVAGIVVEAEVVVEAVEADAGYRESRGFLPSLQVSFPILTFRQT